MDEDALLAQALWAAEQADLYDMGMGSDGAADSDSDYERSSKRRKQQPKRGKAAARPNSSRPPRAAKVAAVAAAPEADSPQPAAAAGAEAGSADAAAAAQAPVPVQAAAGDELTTSGRRKRKDCGQKRDSKGRSWNEAEEAVFAAGLEQHGRDWKAIAAAVGTRDARAVASHAQKHFIKLCLSGTPLPPKVAESGPGYTLSGKLLDPSSAAAQAYGFSLDALQGLEGQALATALSGLLPQGAAAPGDSGPPRDQEQEVRADSRVGSSKRARHRNSGGSDGSSRRHASDPPGFAAGPGGAAEGSGAAAGVSEGDELTALLAAALPPALAASELAARAPTPGNGCRQLQQQQQQQQQQHAEEHASEAAPPSRSSPDPVAAAPAPDSAPDSSDACAPAQEAAPPTTSGADGHQTTGVVTPAAEAASPFAPAAAATAAAAAAADAVNNTDDSGVTEYARSRPRRHLAGTRLVQLGATSESLALMPCSSFLGPAGSGLPGAQPYSVEVDLQAMLVMEVHAHLSSCEVIGLLGGTWQPQARLLTISTAYPCRRAAGSDAATSVELDPAAEVEARGAMTAAGQRCVGWYHSHPVFEARPSLKDMENQRNYQALTRDSGAASSDGGGHCQPGGGGLEPFVGFILSPYDPALTLPHSQVTAFVVQQRGQNQNRLVPYSIRYGLINARQLPGPDTADALRRLLAASANDVGRTSFAALWRPFTALRPGGGGLLGPPLSKLDKLLTGLSWQCSHVPDKAAVQRWLQALVGDVQDQWGVSLPQKEEEQQSAAGLQQPAAPASEQQDPEHRAAAQEQQQQQQPQQQQQEEEVQQQQQQQEEHTAVDAATSPAAAAAAAAPPGQPGAWAAGDAEQPAQPSGGAAAAPGCAATEGLATAVAAAGSGVPAAGDAAQSSEHAARHA